VAVGSGSTVLTSLDGITWTGRNTGANSQLNAIAFGNGTFVALGSDTILSSPDGLTWSTSKTTGLSLSAIAFGNDSFVAVGAEGAILQSVVPPIQPALEALTILSGTAVQITLNGQVGRSYTIQSSTDLMHWQDFTNIVLANPSAPFSDPFARSVPQRFYRAVSH
jgi:hypothetical protein